MRATITIPDERLEELLQLLGTDNRTQAINHAIDICVRDMKIQRLLALRGRVDILSNDEIEAFDQAEHHGG
jgi:hypothetical protein